MSNIKEIWKDVIGYEGYYMISNQGRIKSLDRYVNHYPSGTKLVPGNIMKLSLNRKGYYTIRITKKSNAKTYIFHRLEAKLFIPNPLNLPQINHKNGIKTDNRVENLEWCTNQQNIVHAYKLGTARGRPGKSNHMAKRVIQYLGGVKIKEYECVHDTLKDGFNEFLVGRAARTGLRHHGFNWEYPNKKTA